MCCPCRLLQSHALSVEDTTVSHFQTQIKLNITIYHAQDSQIEPEQRSLLVFQCWGYNYLSVDQPCRYAHCDNSNV